MNKLWSTEELLGRYERELLVWHHRLNHCSLKYLLRLSKRGIIPRKLSKVRKLPPCVACLFGGSHKRPWSTKVKRSCRSIMKPSDTRPRSTTLIDQMVSSQPGIIPQVTGDLTYARFWSDTVFFYHYFDYYYAHLIRGTSAEETLQSK